MGVDAKLFVTAKQGQENLVYAKVKEAIDDWQRDLLKSEMIVQNTTNIFSFIDKNKHNWSNGVASIDTHDFRSFNMHFRVAGESRSLFCTHGCSSDYSNVYEGNKIIFSLGYWGKSDEIMKIVAKAAKEFGEVYYDFNDCDDKDFIKLYPLNN